MIQALKESRNLAPSGLKAFEQISKLWKLNRSQKMILLGGMPYPTYNRYLRTNSASVSHDTLERISYILGIYKALHILIPNKKQANQWIQKDNTQFCGHSALEIMLKGSISDLQRIRTYLDSVRSGK